MINIICDICGGSSSFYSSVNEYNYYICKACDTVFLYPQPSTHELNRYYDGPFIYPTGIENMTELKRKAHRITRKMIQYNPSGYRFLDIGSGYGYLLSELACYDVAAMGIEPSFQLWQQSRTQGLHILHTSLENWNTDLRFDFISLAHVIEHIAEPATFLKKAVATLKPGGILYIETPNIASYQFRAESKDYTYLTPPDHVRLFSLKSLSLILPDELVPLSLTTYTEKEHVKKILKYALCNHVKQNTIHDKSSTSTPQSQNNHTAKTIKHIAVDILAAPLLTFTCNAYGYGSILELYYQKKS